MESPENRMCECDYYSCSSFDSNTVVIKKNPAKNVDADSIFLAGQDFIEKCHTRIRIVKNLDKNFLN